MTADLCSAPHRRAAGVFLACLMGTAAVPALALNFQFPGTASETTATPAEVGSYGLPTGPWLSGATPKRPLEGMTQSTVFQLETPTLSSLQILRPLRDQLRDAGYTIVFECETEGCGGFDFRFDANILPEPDMHVDLGDFRFLSATRDNAEGTEAIGLMVSRSASAGYVQVTQIVPAADTTVLTLQPAGTPLLMSDAGGTLNIGAEAVVTLSTASSAPTETDEMAARLLSGGAVVLEGLEFATGAAELTEGRYSSLAVLAAWLKANPDKTIALVGHTDATGGLDSNIGISRRRAAAVRSRLTEVYGIPAAQVDAQGIGYLAPRDSNLTETGRTNNRRVEAILTSTR